MAFAHPFESPRTIFVRSSQHRHFFSYSNCHVVFVANRHNGSCHLEDDTLGRLRGQGVLFKVPGRTEQLQRCVPG